MVDKLIKGYFVFIVGVIWLDLGRLVDESSEIFVVFLIVWEGW